MGQQFLQNSDAAVKTATSYRTIPLDLMPLPYCHADRYDRWITKLHRRVDCITVVDYHGVVRPPPPLLLQRSRQYFVPQRAVAVGQRWHLSARSTPSCLPVCIRLWVSIVLPATVWASATGQHIVVANQP